MGNKRLWAALEERDKLYAKPEMTDADGMRLGELEGIVGEEDGYTAESDAADSAAGPRYSRRTARTQNGRNTGGQKVRVLLAQALVRTSAGSAARRTYQPSGSWIRFTGCRDFSTSSKAC